MNALVLIIGFAVLSTLSLGSRRITRQSDSDLQNWGNEGRRKPDEDDKNAQGENWKLDGGEDSGSQDEKRTDAKHTEKSELVSDFLGELNDTQENEPEMRGSVGSIEQDTNSLADGKDFIHKQRSKHRRQFKNHSTRSNRKRHNRKLKEEIEELHSDLTHIAEDLGKLSEKENELEREIGELKNLRHSSKTHTKQTKNKDAKSFRHVKKYKHHNSNKDLSDEDNQFGSIEIEIKDVEDHGSESPLREEMKDLEKDIDETVSETDELRRKNQELCRLLHLSLTRQKDLGTARGNDDFYEELDKLSSDTGESLEDQFLKVCEGSHSTKNNGRRKKHKLNSSEDLDKNDKTESEDSSMKYSDHEDEITRINRKGRQFPRTLSAHQDKKESRRQFHDSSKMRKSEQKLLKIKLRDEENDGNMESEAEEEIMLGNDTIKIDEISSITDHDGEDQNLDNEDEVPLSFIDDGSYLEEEANMTISTDVEDKQKVYDHIASVDEESFCGKPRPVVIYPSDHYPVPRKYYTPQGTILHRCSKHSGCCPIEKLTCVPAKKEKVVLHFFAAVLDGSSTVVPHVEKLHFVNHTKCGCVFKHHAHLYL